MVVDAQFRVGLEVVRHQHYRKVDMTQLVNLKQIVICLLLCKTILYWVHSKMRLGYVSGMQKSSKNIKMRPRPFFKFMVMVRSRS